MQRGQADSPAEAENAPAALTRLARALEKSGYRFTTVTPLTHRRVNSRPGNAWARGLEDVFGWSRPFKEDALPSDIFDLMQLAGVVERAGEGWRSRVRFSALNDRLFVHSAFPTEDADSVFFGPDTYRFAAAIEREIASVASRGGCIRRAVDIGCGAGIGAILIALAWPDAEVFAADINDLALDFTKINAEVAGTPNVAAVHSDLLGNIAGAFDLIVANPPYLVDRAERAYRHGGGALGAALSLAILDAAIERLAPGSTLVLYTGVAIVAGLDPFLAEAGSRLAASTAPIDWTYREIDPDVFGEELSEAPYSAADRIAAVLLTVRKRAGE